MRKVILVNGDIATGKSHFALILKERFNLPLYTKDEYKEKLADSYTVFTYALSHELSIQAMNMLVESFVREAVKGNDVILEANFHEDYLFAIKEIADKFDYEILDINLVGTPSILYMRYIHRKDHEDRHKVHAINRINDYPEFERYVLERKNERQVGTVIEVDADDLSYQKDEELIGKIEDFLKAEK